MQEKTKRFLKDFALIIGIPLLLVTLVCTYDDGTEYSQGDLWRAKEQARQEGYNEGYEEGYDDGYENGHKDGYTAGYNDQ